MISYSDAMESSKRKAKGDWDELESTVRLTAPLSGRRAVSKCRDSRRSAIFPFIATIDISIMSTVVALQDKREREIRRMSHWIGVQNTFSDGFGFARFAEQAVLLHTSRSV